jgi:Trypsin
VQKRLSTDARATIESDLRLRGMKIQSHTKASQPLNRLNFALLISTPVALVAFACAAPSEPRETMESAVQALHNAPLDTANKWAVGICQENLADDVDAGRKGICGGAGFCSATLVAPNLVLTAQHCVRQFDGAGACNQGTYNKMPRAAGKLRVTLSDTVREGAPIWKDVSEVLVPDQNRLCEDDIALLILAQPIAASETAPIGVELFRDMKANPPAKVAMVSRGAKRMNYLPETDAAADATFVLDRGTYDRGEWRRRILENIPFLCNGGSAACVLRDRATPEYPNFNYAVPAAMFLYGQGLLSGDSGGAVIDQATLAAGAPKVIGVGTWYGVDDSGQTSQSAATSTMFHRKFILDGALRAATMGGYPAPAWTVPPAVTTDAGAPQPAVDAGPVAQDAAATPPVATPSDPTSSGCSIGSKHARPWPSYTPLLALAALALRKRRSGAATPRSQRS